MLDALQIYIIIGCGFVVIFNILIMIFTTPKEQPFEILKFMYRLFFNLLLMTLYPLFILFILIDRIKLLDRREQIKKDMEDLRKLIEDKIKNKGDLK